MTGSADVSTEHIPKADRQKFIAFSAALNPAKSGACGYYKGMVVCLNIAMSHRINIQ